MDVEEAIRTRRTHKAYAPDPVDRATLEELLDLARWAPNHHLTNPWRFRVLGPGALGRLKDAAGPEAAVKLDRAPTLVAVSVVTAADPVEAAEDRDAAAVAAYIVLLAAHARGLAGYWRTPGDPARGRRTGGAGHPGRGARARACCTSERRVRRSASRSALPPEDFVTWLD